jgi:hypothetical protein
MTWWRCKKVGWLIINMRWWRRRWWRCRKIGWLIVKSVGWWRCRKVGWLIIKGVKKRRNMNKWAGRGHTLWSGFITD